MVKEICIKPWRNCCGGSSKASFSTSKVFSSISEMQADTSVNNGEFVIIQSHPEEEDNAKLFVKTEEGFNFVVDLSGFRGPQGADGKDGRDGEQGLSGPQGEQGPKGDTGQSGPQGPQGLNGLQGPKGDTGAIGATGPMGPTGPRGLTGPMGTPGPQGATGPKGADGKTSYHHWAYSDNADGTGLTLTDNGQRYMGYYTDYTQADSTDKAKYTWADRWAKIEVGGRNLAQRTSSDWSTPYTSFSGSANTCPPLYKVLIDDLAVGDTLKSRIVLKYTNIIPASGRTATILLQGIGNITSWGAGAYNSSPTKPISGSGEMVFEHEFKITADHLKNQFWDWAFRTDYIASGSLQWKLAKVEKGNVFTDWSRADEDIQADISVTDWATSTVNASVRWKVQGKLVIVDYDVTFPTGGTKHIVTVPTKYVPKALMLTATAWHTDSTRDRKAQLNAGGDLYILAVAANQRYCGQIIWTY